MKKERGIGQAGEVVLVGDADAGLDVCRPIGVVEKTLRGRAPEKEVKLWRAGEHGS